MQTQLETILSQLIAIPSITADRDACRDVLDFVRRSIAPLGLHIISSSQTASHPWFYATSQPTLTPDILLAAHLDVVPASPEGFILKKQDGLLFGRGVYDMKLAAACYIEFLTSHASELHNLNIGVLFSTDEEIGGESMLDILATGLRPKVVFIPDGGGDWRIEARAKGFYCIELQANGKAAHGSRPWEGDNALHRIMDITHTLRGEYPFKGPNAATLAITKVTGGQAVNQIADTASALLDFRTFDAKEIEEFKRRVFELGATHSITVTPTQSGAPLLFDPNHPNVQSFLQAFKQLRGKPAEYVDSYGGTDARYFVPYNIPCIIMEPKGGGRHAESEWLEASDLEAYYRLIEQWVLTPINKTAADAPISAPVTAL